MDADAHKLLTRTHWVGIHAQERSLDIREMNARIIVTRAGNVSVTERFVVQFNGSWNA